MIYPNNLKNRHLSKSTPDGQTHRSSPGYVLDDGKDFHDRDIAGEKNDYSSCLGITIQTLQKLAPKTIAVIGDLILDRYTFGTACRVSPEAPVPVLSITKEESKAGGAGNVALNLRSLGMHVRLMGRLGRDQAGKELTSLLDAKGVDCSFCLEDSSYKTSVKNRLIASSQQLLRVDQEVTGPIQFEQESLLLENLDRFLQGVHLIAISDYAKGLLSPTFLRAIIDRAKALGIFVVVDPKGGQFSKYRGADLIKPNFKEAMEAVPPSERDLEKAAKWICEHVEIEHVIITKSEHGIYLYTKKEGFRHFPALQREVRDSTGAGDTVLATIAAALASGCALDESLCLSNLAGSITVEKIGCANVSKEEMAHRLLDRNPTGKVLSWEQFQAVSSTFEHEPLSFLHFHSSHKVTLDELKALRTKALSLRENGLTIVLFEDREVDEHTIELIAGLDSIDWVVYGANCIAIPPSKILQV